MKRRRWRRLLVKKEEKEEKEEHSQASINALLVDEFELKNFLAPEKASS
jgi:hypothetical protein